MSYPEVKQRFPQKAEDLTVPDMQMFYPNEVANLRLIYPYIHEDLNNITMRFSTCASARYGNALELADDMEGVLKLFN